MGFITNITNPLPTTGEFGHDNIPSGMINNGGIEVTPQNGGNVTNNISESGLNNDVSISGSGYNSIGGTDAQKIGSSASNPNMGNRANPQAQRLILSQQRNTVTDSPFDDQPYALDSYDWYKNESPAGSLTPVYESAFNVQGASVNESGEPIGNYPYTINAEGKNRGGSTFTVTYTMGGSTVTMGDIEVDESDVDERGKRRPTEPDARDINACRNNGPGLIDEPCEIVSGTCNGTNYPLGKKMRVFQGIGGENCSLSGYWLQAPFKSTGISDMSAHAHGLDCEIFKGIAVKTPLVSIYDNPRIDGFPQRRRDPSKYCNCETAIALSGGVSGEALGGKTFGHLLYYVGTSLAGIKNKEWCNLDHPLIDVDMSGHAEWFWEGARCNADGTRNEVFNSGKLFGCCCDTINLDSDGNATTQVNVLTEVDSIAINTSDDPCDCLRRYRRGAQFLTEWNAAVNGDDVNHKVFVSGCVAEDALDRQIASGLAEVGLAICSGSEPSWNETECAWNIPVKRISRCPQGDIPSKPWHPDPYESLAWCPSGDALTITDRNLFYSNATSVPNLNIYDHVNYASCTGACSCTSGAPLFSVGDYVDVDQHVVGLPYDGSSWLEWELYDLAQSGAANGSGFQWTDSPVSGCNASGNSWKVTRREYGDAFSWRETYDCTWGYQIEFTGCAPCSGGSPHTCSATGMAPNFSSPYDLFIPQTYLSSGTGCTKDASCSTGCSIGDSLFDVGDYVNLTAAVVSGCRNTLGGFSGAFDIDFTASGDGRGHTSTEPFSTGCGGIDSSICEWTFSKTGGGFGPDLGDWVLSSSGTCCDCAATQPTGNIEENGVQRHFDCGTATSGCDILTLGWKIMDKISGDATSSPDSLDCTWGYAVSFTGCPPLTGDCVATGYAPVFAQDWIPEIYFTSGSGC